MVDWWPAGSAGILLGVTRVYQEIIDFIAAGSRPDDVAAFQPSDQAKERVADLLSRQKASGLTPEEASELAHYLHLEHLMRLAKARARRHISGNPVP